MAMVEPQVATAASGELNQLGWSINWGQGVEYHLCGLEGDQDGSLIAGTDNPGFGIQVQDQCLQAVMSSPKLKISPMLFVKRLIGRQIGNMIRPAVDVLVPPLCHDGLMGSLQIGKDNPEI